MRRHGLTVTLANVGGGETNTVLPPDALLSPDDKIVGPATPSASNLRLANGRARIRPGNVTFADRPTTNAVTGLYQARFDTNVTEYIRGDGTAARYLSGAAWTTFSAAGTGGRWCFDMVRRAGSATPANQVMFCGGGDGDSVFTYVGGGAAATGVATGTFLGARTIIGHRGRALVCNVYDVGLSARKFQRVYYSIVGDPTTFTGIGSGFVDLDDDAYPIANGLVVGGNVVILKGNNIGGSISVGTPTGVPNQPYRWDTINRDNVGVLVPRSVVQITPDLVFFLGHDGFYLYDGARGLARVGEAISQDIRRRIAPDALHNGFAWFNTVANEIVLHIPTGGDTYPTETWVFNVTERRVYGPWTYPDQMTSACPYATTSTLTIDTIPASTIDTIPFATIDEMGSTASARGWLFGTSTGYTRQGDESQTTDANGTITGTYTTATIRAEGRRVFSRQGVAVPLGMEAMLTLQDVVLLGTNLGAWTPTVDVSTDGGNTWTTISDGTAMGGTSNLNRAVTKYYTCSLSGWAFQLRVRATSSLMDLQSIRLEFTHGGDERNG